MPTSEEIMLTFFGRDQVSNVTKSIDGNIKSMANSAMTAVNNMSAGFMNIGSSFDSMLTGLTGKTASDMIFGTSSKAETNKVLLKNMTETAASAEALYKTVDEVTNSSLTSMQELIPAMNAFKAATGASDQELTNVTDDIANFGAAVLAQTGSTELAQTAMMDLSKGIKGAFASLDQYGVSEDALMRTGLWSGKEDDVEGYMAAVTEVIGSTEELMQTNEGLDAQIGKAFSRAGKKIGNEFLPFIKDIKQGFLNLDEAVGGNLAAGILATAQGVEFLNQGLFQVTTMANGIRDLQAAWGGVKDVISSAKTALEGFKAASNVTETAANTSEMIGSAAAHASGPNSVGIDFDIDDDELKRVSEKIDGSDKQLDKLDKKSKKVSKKSNKVSKQMGKLTKGLGNIGKLGPAAATASAETATFSSAFAGFGASLGAMIAPILMVAAVIAIIIPIIGALAAEALLVARGVAEVIKALDFDSLDLSGSIEGIKQVGSAMWELARAMGAMTLAGATTLIYNFISGLMLFQNPIEVAVDHLKSAIKTVNELGSVSEVDSSIPAKLKTLTTALQAVGTAMNEMGSVTGTVLMGGLLTLGGLLGSYTDNLRVAKTELTNAVNILNEFGSLGTVNEGVVNKLKAVTDALSSAATAMGKIGDINWAVGMTNLNPFSDVANALEQTREDIIQASEVLNTFTGIQEVPQGIGNKLQNVSSALESASKALESLSKIDSEVSLKGGNPFKNVIASLRSAKNDIYNAAAILATLNNIPAIPEGTGQKIQRVGWTATNVVNAIKTLNNIQGVNLNAETLISTFQQARNALSQISEQLASLNNIYAIPEGLGDKIQRVGWTANTVSSTVQTINRVPAVTSNGNVQMAVTAVKNTVTQLNQLAGTSLNGNISSLLTTVTNTLNQLKATLTAMSGGFTASGTAIGTSIVNGVRTGLAPLPSTVITAVSTATASAASTGWTGGSRIGTSVTNGFKSALKLSAAMKTEMGYVTQAINSGINAAKSAAQRGAEEVVEAFKRGIETGSPGAMAWAMFDEMGYIKDFIVSEGKQVISSARRLGQNIVDGFGNPALTIDPLTKLNNINGSLTTEHIGSMETMMSRAPPSADNRPVAIYIYEGAVQLDARNLTTRESKQVLINALEGLDVVSGIDIKRSAG